MTRTPILVQGRKRAYAGEVWLILIKGYEMPDVVKFTVTGQPLPAFWMFGDEEKNFASSEALTLIRRIDTSLPKKKGKSRGKKA
jgi:hypothetical protein